MFGGLTTEAIWAWWFFFVVLLIIDLIFLINIGLLRLSTFSYVSLVVIIEGTGVFHLIYEIYDHNVVEIFPY